AELAGFQPPARPAAPASTLPAPVQVKLQELKEATSPAQRETAAMVLSVGDARTAPEVVAALTYAARHDPAASVRTCLARCLLQISDDAPQVVGVLSQMQADADADVQRAARFALEQASKRPK